MKRNKTSSKIQTEGGRSPSSSVGPGLQLGRSSILDRIVA